MFGICGDRAQNGSILHVSIQRITWRMNSCTCYIPAATRAPIHTLAPATSVSFILKLFKLVTQSNTYNFTIMAIVAVWLPIATFRCRISVMVWRRIRWAGPHVPRRHTSYTSSQMLGICNTSLPAVFSPSWSIFWRRPRSHRVFGRLMA